MELSKRVQTQVKKWAETNLTDEKIAVMVDKEISEAVADGILGILGFRSAWSRDEWEIKRDSPLYSQVSAIAAKNAQAWVTKYLDTETPELTKTQMAALKKVYNEEFERTARRLLDSRGEDAGRVWAMEYLEGIVHYEVEDYKEEEGD